MSIATFESTSTRMIRLKTMSQGRQPPNSKANNLRRALGTDPFIIFVVKMKTVKVSCSGRDVRGLRKWSHLIRSGPDVTIGCSGVLVEPGVVLAPIGSVLDGWADTTVLVDGVKATQWSLLDASSDFWEFRFCVISCVVDGAAAAPRPLALVVEQFAMHLTQPQWGCLVQPCRVVARPTLAVSLIDVSCYEGGEGGLVTGRDQIEPSIVARGLMADGAPTGLSVCVSISHLLSLPSKVARSVASGPPSQAVVVRGLEGRWGTGFAVGSPGTIVTAAHVVCAAGTPAPERVMVISDAGRGKGAWARVEHAWPGGWLDVCVLKLNDCFDCSQLELCSADVKTGDNVCLVSATQWNVPMETRGCVMSCAGGVQLVCSVPAWGGCSGGPLLDEKSGHVAGLLVSTASVAKIRRPRMSLFLPVSLWGRFVDGGQEKLEDESLRTRVEKVWKNDAPDLPPKFKEFVSKL